MVKNIRAKKRNDTSSKKRKVAKKKIKIQRQKTPRTRNAGTLTEVEYFGKIRSALRKAFRFWKPMAIALEKAARVYKGPNTRQKKEYQCARCEHWFPRTQVEIDHIEECGSLMCLEDIPIFVERLTREEPEAYQVLCKPCHKEKTKVYLQDKRKKQ